MKVKEKMAVASISKTLTKLGGGSSFLLSHRAPPRLYSSSAAAALSSAPQLSSSSQDQGINIIKIIYLFIVIISLWLIMNDQ